MSRGAVHTHHLSADPPIPTKICLSIYFNSSGDSNQYEKWSYFGTTPVWLLFYSGFNRIFSHFLMSINLNVWIIRQSKPSDKVNSRHRHLYICPPCKILAKIRPNYDQIWQVSESNPQLLDQDLKGQVSNWVDFHRLIELDFPAPPLQMKYSCWYTPRSVLNSVYIISTVVGSTPTRNVRANPFIAFNQIANNHRLNWLNFCFVFCFATLLALLVHQECIRMLSQSRITLWLFKCRPFKMRLFQLSGMVKQEPKDSFEHQFFISMFLFEELMIHNLCIWQTWLDNKKMMWDPIQK